MFIQVLIKLGHHVYFSVLKLMNEIYNSIVYNFTVNNIFYLSIFLVNQIRFLKKFAERRLLI